MQRIDRRKSKSTGYSVLTGCALAILLFTFMALAVDAGNFQGVKRRMQSAADAAAVAAVLEMQAKSGNQVTAGRHDASLNGFTNGANHVTVTINVPPTSGSYSGNKHAVEAIVSQPVSTCFMGILCPSTVTVNARAVGALQPGTSCSANIDGQCGIVVDSGSSGAVNTSGSACVSGTSVEIVGDYDNNSGCGHTPTPDKAADLARRT